MPKKPTPTASSRPETPVQKLCRELGIEKDPTILDDYFGSADEVLIAAPPRRISPGPKKPTPAPTASSRPESPVQKLLRERGVPSNPKILDDYFGSADEVLIAAPPSRPKRYLGPKIGSWHPDFTPGGSDE